MAVTMAITSTIPTVYKSTHSLVLNTLRYQERVLSLDDTTLSFASPISFATTLADSDTLTLSQKGSRLAKICTSYAERNGRT